MKNREIIQGEALKATEGKRKAGRPRLIDEEVVAA